MRIYGLLLAALLLISASCGSDNAGPAMTAGSVSGDITIGGPFNGAVELNVGLFTPGSDTALQSAVAGRVTSVATASLAGRTITFSFTDVPFGVYEVAVYSTGAANTYYYRSAALTLSEGSPEVVDFSADASFTGNGPWGTISGIALTGATAFPAERVVFVGFSPVSAPQNVLQTLVEEADITGGQLVFNVDHLAYGSWLVGLYGYDPVTHDVAVYGLKDTPVTIDATHELNAGVTFAADFAGDPGADPQLGSISGTVNFSAPLPAGGLYYVAANTVPPQQGAPPSVVEVTAQAVGGDNQLDYTLPLLPNDIYSVSIFSYDMATHQATYFGQYDGTIELSDVSANPTGVDFTADVSIID